MGKFIHISLRRNLLYLLHLIIHYYLRKVVLVIINTKYNFSDSLIFTLLILLAYQGKSLKNIFPYFDAGHLS